MTAKLSRCLLRRLLMSVDRAVAETPARSRTFSTSRATAADKKLFTPGPLGVTMSVKEAMLRDLGSRDVEFINTVKFIRSALVDVAGASTDEYTCVPMQGSGTFAVESVFQTTVPRSGGKVLVFEGGAYGKRLGQICRVLGIDVHVESVPENEKVSPALVDKVLKSDPAFTHVAVVHCETSSGVVNPVEDIGRVVKSHNGDIIYFVDAMSSFGAIPLDMSCGVDYLVSSANKCLQGVPGFAYLIARTSHLLTCEGNSRSLSLDAYDQYVNMESTSQFRFTPPTHTMLAFKQALLEFAEEGGVEGRSRRYQKNREILREGMTGMGFQEFLDSSHDGYIITSYSFPSDPNFDFKEFYSRLSDMDQVIYPGKVLNSDCFRIGNIGQLTSTDMLHLLKCIEAVCADMGIKLPVSN